MRRILMTRSNLTFNPNSANKSAEPVNFTLKVCFLDFTLTAMCRKEPVTNGRFRAEQP